MTAMDDFSDLKNSGLFRYFPDSATRQLIKISTVRNFAEGAVIYASGDPATTLYGVLEGFVKLLAESPQGKQHFYGIALSGHWFGEVSALDGIPRRQTVVAQQAVTLFCVERESLFAMMEDNPDLYKHFIRVLCNRLRLAGEYIEEAAFLPVRLRLAKQLLRFDKVSKGTSLKLSQEDLAASLSVSRQSIYRPLIEWQRQGWIRQQYGAIEVVNRDQLRHYIAMHMDE